MSPATMKLPKNLHIGKREYNGILTGGKAAYTSVAQIFIECAGNEPDCRESISILPDKRFHFKEELDSVSDEQAGAIFSEKGWLVKDYNSDKYTRCPVCKTKLN